MRTGTVIFFLALLITAVYYGLLPSKTVRLKGVYGEVATENYRIWVSSQGKVGRYGDLKVQDDPPYNFVLKVMPENTAAGFVEFQDVQVYACGTTTKLYTYDAPLIHTIDYFDYKKPLAYYELAGKVVCHGNAIMDLSFTLRDAAQQPLTVAQERIMAEAYERVPSTLGYWWSMVWDR